MASNEASSARSFNFRLVFYTGKNSNQILASQATFCKYHSWRQGIDSNHPMPPMCSTNYSLTDTCVRDVC